MMGALKGVPVSRRKFSVDGSHYVYDTSTSGIFEAGEIAYEIVDSYLDEGDAAVRDRFDGHFTEAQIDSAVELLTRLQRDHGMLRPSRAADHWAGLDENSIGRSLTAPLGKLILNITEQCNQRCRYCTYSGLYTGERVHSNTSMSWKIAKSSIDYFLSRAHASRASTISFYGGEPLLKWDLLKRCIQYVRNDHSQKDIHLRIASNATLLNKKILHFLMDRDIQLQLSLDGPQEIHDSGRVFANGRGTHARIVKILREIRELDQEYFRRNVSLRCTLDLGNDIVRVFRYFSSPPFRELPVRVGGIRETDCTGYSVPVDVRRRHRRRLRTLRAMYLDHLREGTDFNHSLFHNLFQRTYDLVPKGKGEEPSSSGLPIGACLPGARRLFVSSEGRFHTCPNFCGPGSDIGDYKRGMDVEKVRRLVDTMIGFCSRLCASCWARKLCSQCYIHALENGRMKLDRLRDSCRREKALITRSLEDFVYLLRHEPDSAVHLDYALRGRMEKARSAL